MTNSLESTGTAQNGSAGGRPKCNLRYLSSPCQRPRARAAHHGRPPRGRQVPHGRVQRRGVLPRVLAAPEEAQLPRVGLDDDPARHGLREVHLEKHKERVDKTLSDNI